VLIRCDRNSGNRNSANRNSGDLNSGDLNSGYLNNGRYNTGFFCTGDAEIKAFNKKTKLTYQEYESLLPSWVYSISPTEWIPERSMTEQEKIDNPEFYVMEGYLKVINHKEAIQKAWEKASTKDKKKTKTLPNFDKKIFEEITGIKV